MGHDVPTFESFKQRIEVGEQLTYGILIAYKENEVDGEG
jgi:hypothetical protein